MFIIQTVKAMNTDLAYSYDCDFLDEYVVNDFRFDRSVSQLVFDELAPMLKECDKYLVCGSYRRGKPTIKDLDIVVIHDDFYKLAKGMDCIWHGTARTSFIINGVQVDLRCATPETWVTMVLYFTGSREENIRLRSIAKRRGWKLNEYGLWNGDKRIPCDSEQAVYAALGLRYREPKNR